MALTPLGHAASGVSDHVTRSRQEKGASFAGVITHVSHAVHYLSGDF